MVVVGSVVVCKLRLLFVVLILLSIGGVLL